MCSQSACARVRRVLVLLVLFAALLPPAAAAPPERVKPKDKTLLDSERLIGKGVWVDPFLRQRLAKGGRVRTTVWFATQFLGDGEAYLRRAKEFKKSPRSVMRAAVLRTLKQLSKTSHEQAAKSMAALEESGGIQNVDRHWIVNGFSCGVTEAGLATLEQVPGVRKIFCARSWGRGEKPLGETAPGFGVVTRAAFDPTRYKHPWYIRQLLADKVWKEFGVTGRGTLNVVHDFNFIFNENLTANLHRNGGEIPSNGKDDDGNGLVDDYHGYNFDWRTGALTVAEVAPQETNGQKMHGFMCAAIICGAGSEKSAFEFGIAPEGTWAPVAARGRFEAAIEWAIEQGADTYSMSFSRPGQEEYRSHLRKVMEHGSLCGVYFVSGAGNFAVKEKVPVQMRQPEDIPNVVFAAAGVQRDLSRTRFSSQGPVEWKTEHYHEGLVDKPAVCAFNANLPWLRLDGSTRPGGLGGNSFAGPMFCGSIALMLSADPELLPWDLREIITSTAMDVAAKGFDHQTGHGLINCYRAVKEVLRRKAKREHKPARKYTGRTKGDVLDTKALADQMEVIRLEVVAVGPKGQAAALGVKPGDVIRSYNGQALRSRAELARAKEAAAEAGLTEVPVVLVRGDEALEVTFETGRLGINAADIYKEPVFR